MDGQIGLVGQIELSWTNWVWPDKLDMAILGKLGMTGQIGHSWTKVEFCFFKEKCSPLGRTNVCLPLKLVSQWCFGTSDDTHIHAMLTNHLVGDMYLI